MLYIPYLINIFFYFQMVQAIQVLRFHLLELEKVSIILRGDKHIFSKINLIAILSLDATININIKVASKIYVVMDT